MAASPGDRSRLGEPVIAWAVGAAPPRGSTLPDGFVVELEPSTQVHADGSVLFGGRPRTLLRLHETVRVSLADRRVVVRDARSAVLARRLLKTGMGQPEPAPAELTTVADVQIVIPVKDRPAELRRLLGAIRADPDTELARVIVVDDGSVRPEPCRELADEFAADLLRHDRCRGPSAARNTGLRAASSELVAMLDSDCAPSPGWLRPLVAHFADPEVMLTGPRIVSMRTPTGQPLSRLSRVLSSYEHVSSALDMGARRCRVAPGLPVSYLPSAALLARRAGLGTGFVEGLSVAEDVDLVWRLVAAGATVRYEPRSEVGHEHRTAVGAFLQRRAYYGTSAALLAQRHANTVAPIVIDRRSALAWCMVLVAHPVALSIIVGVQLVSIRRLAGVLRGYGIAGPTAMSADLVWRGWLSSGRPLLRRPGREYWPLAVVAAVLSRRVRRRVLLALLLDAGLAWCEQTSGSADVDRDGPGPLAFGVIRRAEDLAYGTGVWLGAWRARSLAALAPRLVRAPRRGRLGGPPRRATM